MKAIVLEMNVLCIDSSPYIAIAHSFDMKKSTRTSACNSLQVVVRVLINA